MRRRIARTVGEHNGSAQRRIILRQVRALFVLGYDAGLLQKRTLFPLENDRSAKGSVAGIMDDIPSGPSAFAFFLWLW